MDAVVCTTVPGFTGFFLATRHYVGCVCSRFDLLLTGIEGKHGFTGFYRVLPGFTGFYWVLLGFRGFDWIFLGLIEFSWV